MNPDDIISPLPSYCLLDHQVQSAKPRLSLTDEFKIDTDSSVLMLFNYSYDYGYSEWSYAPTGVRRG